MDRADGRVQVQLPGGIEVNPFAEIEGRKISQHSKACQDLRRGQFAIEVPGMALPVSEAARGDFWFTRAMHVDQMVQRAAESVCGRPGICGHPRQMPVRYEDGAGRQS